jgi:hypothetical protein
MASFNESVNPGLFLNTTDIINVETINSGELDNDKLRELFIKIVQVFNIVDIVVNLKSSGIYSFTEFVDSNTFPANSELTSLTNQAPTPRQEFTKLFLVGPLLNAASLTIPHSLSGVTSFTSVSAQANDTTGGQSISLPFVSVSGAVAAGNIELLVTANDIVITPTGNATNFNLVWVILKYLKQ